MNGGWGGEKKEGDDCKGDWREGRSWRQMLWGSYGGEGAREGDVCAGELKSTFVPSPFSFWCVAYEKEITHVIL